MLNQQGYRSYVDFNDSVLDSLRATKKIVLALGDSYTEGCCANPIDSSFIDLLNQSASDYYILNFGVGSSNPVHYENILNRYLDVIKPDLVLVNFYLGNDVLRADIKAPANIPQTFIIRDFSWLSSTVPPFYQKEIGQTNFKNHIQAYDFYIKHFTLFHEDVNWFEQLLTQSVLASRAYLAAKNGYAVLSWMMKGNTLGDDVDRTRVILLRMKARCDTENINIHFSLIPSPKHVKKQTDLKAKFDELFQHLDCSNPETSNFTIADFDGEKTSNHYINSGHLKHSLYLNKQLNRLLIDTNEEVLLE
ncbi:MAG: hypothetical protein K9G46_00190 [Flavobacteriales bacterium]|nr:hypothetical protein [Flavobacteriales bacterium]